MNRNTPLIISREGLQILIEGVVNAANSDPHVRLIDPFVQLTGCSWCHRRIGDIDLVRGICPNCLLPIRGANRDRETSLQRRQRSSLIWQESK